jgi:CheY-like chemotaxis protein
MGKLPAADPAQKALRETIERQSAQLARVVDDMIDIARITRGDFSIERSPVDLRDAVRRSLETAAPLIQAGRHRLEVELPAAPLTVEGDVHRLTQLLANLLNNAARYTPPGGEIALRLRRQRGWALVEVRDSGRGIAPAMLERIFDMFVHGRPALERVGEGLGVGLALARRIAEAHDGTLTAASAGENQGAEFVLRLPAVAALPEAAPAKSGEPAPRPAEAKRVLVVDDNTDAAATLEILLRSLGHEVETAYDGIEALRVAAAFAPDIVLLDIGLPGLDGYEVARRLRALHRERPLRIVAITGWGQEADRARSQEAGVDVHLVKPVDPTTLTSLLESNNDGHTLH